MLCGAKCSEESPLQGSHPHDSWGGLRPWARYKKHKADGTKSPQGKFCLICVNDFRCRPDHLKVIGGMKKFYNSIRDPVSKLHGFQRSVAFWIKRHNEPGRPLRLRDSKGLEESQNLTQNKDTGLRRKQNLIFVELEQFKQDFPERSTEKTDWKSVDGVMKEGVWITTEQKGYHRFEAYEDDRLTHSTVLDDGKNNLNKDQVREKYNVAAEAWAETAKKRREDNFSMGASIDNLLAMAAACSKGFVQAPEKKPGNKNDSDDSDDDKSGTSDEDDDDDVGRSAAVDLLMGAKPAPKAKASAKGVSRTPSKRAPPPTSPGPLNLVDSIGGAALYSP